MGLFRRKQEVRAETTEALEQSQEIDGDLLKALLSDVSITRYKAMQIPAVNACVNLISYIVSSIPIKLYKQNDDGTCEEVPDDERLVLLNHDTGDTLTATQFWRAMLSDYFLGKGAYAYKNMAGNRIKSLHYIEDTRWTKVDNDDPIFKQYKISVNGNQYYPYEFFKILRHTKDGMESKGICEENSLILQVAYSSLMLEKINTLKGGNKKGFLQTDKPVDEPTKKSLRKSWREFFSNDDNSESVMILSNGLQFKETSSTSAELQLNEQKQTNTGQITMLFNIPETLVCGLKSGTSDKDIDDFIKFGLTPVLNDIECSLDRDMLLESEKVRNTKYKNNKKYKYYFAFDLKEITRGNIKERYEAYKIAKETGWLGTNEIRNLEDLKEIPNFNVVSLSLADVIYNIDSGEYFVPNTKQVTDGTSKDMKEGEKDGSRN